jgi:alanine racemase
MEHQHHLTYARIDINALRHNLNEICRLARQNTFAISTRPAEEKKPPQIAVMTVVKADAYGHGMVPVAKVLNKQGVDIFGVSDVKEGIQLREAGIKKPIILFESTLPDFAEEIERYKLTPMVCTLELAAELNNYAAMRKKPIDVHIEIDTGMGRLGIWHEEALAFIEAVFKLKWIRVTGLMTHFPAADTDKKFTLQQVKNMYKLVVSLDKRGMVVPYIHAANSMGLAGYETSVLNLVRPGLMLYGLYPHPRLKRTIDLKPVMSVHTRIIFTKDIAKGRSISYGRTFFTRKNMKIAVLPVGYSDGYFRQFSNKASVILK